MNKLIISIWANYIEVINLKKGYHFTFDGKEYKFCTRCGMLLQATEVFFHRRTISIDGLAFVCKYCKKKQDKEYREKNNEKLKEQKKYIIKKIEKDYYNTIMTMQKKKILNIENGLKIIKIKLKLIQKNIMRIIMKYLKRKIELTKKLIESC